MEKNVLVIGAGITGIETSLLLANAGRKVYLVEKSSIIGGNIIKCEHVFPNMECATCMIAPKQQELLQNENIELLTLSQVNEVKGEPGNFSVKVHQKARYVDLINCIGCSECFNVCPVNVQNEFEGGLSDRKAIYIPCAGSLPNVPTIDTENCIRFKGKECQACKEACMFEAINFDHKDEQIELKVGAIVVATGFKLFDIKKYSRYNYGKFDNIYSSWDFERMFSSNGPTEGEITLKNGEAPKSVAIIHCVGREEKGYCSGLCCMYSLKFVHYLKEKIKDINITEFYKDICTPGKGSDKFYEEMKSLGIDLIRAQDIQVARSNGTLTVRYETEVRNPKSEIRNFDMVILSPGLEPGEDSENTAKILDITCDQHGFFKEEHSELAPVNSTKQGIFIAGCAQSPKDVQASIAQAQSAVGKILSLFR